MLSDHRKGPFRDQESGNNGWRFAMRSFPLRARATWLGRNEFTQGPSRPGQSTRGGASQILCRLGPLPTKVWSQLGGRRCPSPIWANWLEPKVGPSFMSDWLERAVPRGTGKWCPSVYPRGHPFFSYQRVPRIPFPQRVAATLWRVAPIPTVECRLAVEAPEGNRHMPLVERQPPIGNPPGKVDAG